MVEESWSPRGNAFKATTQGIKDNVKRLEKAQCCPHKFKFSPKGYKGKYVCEVCAGVLDIPQHHWYRTGLLHGAELAKATCERVSKNPAEDR